MHINTFIVKKIIIHIFDLSVMLNIVMSTSNINGINGINVRGKKKREI